MSISPAVFATEMATYWPRPSENVSTLALAFAYTTLARYPFPVIVVGSLFVLTARKPFLQVIPNGILAIQNIPRQYQYGYSDFYGTWNQLAYGHKGTEYPTIFIKTNKSFIVGQTIREYIRYSGKNFTYPTTYGTATVMVFNIVSDYSKKQDQYFALEEEIENLQKQQFEFEENARKNFYFYK